MYKTHATTYAQRIPIHDQPIYAPIHTNIFDVDVRCINVCLCVALSVLDQLLHYVKYVETKN